MCDIVWSGPVIYVVTQKGARLHAQPQARDRNTHIHRVLASPWCLLAAMLPLTAAAHGAALQHISFLGRSGMHNRSQMMCRSCRHGLAKPLLSLAPVAVRRMTVAATAAKKTPSIEELAARDQLLDLLLEAKSQDEVHFWRLPCRCRHVDADLIFIDVGVLCVGHATVFPAP
jgi:hypothetical protein